MVKTGADFTLAKTPIVDSNGIIKSSRPVLWFGCAAHTMQLAIKDALKVCKAVESLVSKCQNLAIEFHRKQYLSQALCHVQQKYFKENFTKGTPLAVVVPVETRWNS
ncbi:hypothetical protein BGZ76_005850, partial [Entomortierella beljakovae]